MFDNLMNSTKDSYIPPKEGAYCGMTSEVMKLDFNGILIESIFVRRTSKFSPMINVNC